MKIRARSKIESSPGSRVTVEVPDPVQPPVWSVNLTLDERHGSLSAYEFTEEGFEFCARNDFHVVYQTIPWDDFDEFVAQVQRGRL